jgi:hypothetical protein
MLRKIPILAASLLALAGCAGTAAERQQGADNLFGDAKMVYVGLSGFVSIYNMLPICGAPAAPNPPLCYSEPVGDVINKTMQIAADSIEASEKIFAASNTDEDAKLRAAKAAQAATKELREALFKYGVTQVKNETR